MFFLLYVAILVIQTNRPAGAQHTSFLSQTHGFLSDGGWWGALQRDGALQDPIATCMPPGCDQRVQLHLDLGVQMHSELLRAISMSLEAMATGAVSVISSSAH